MYDAESLLRNGMICKNRYLNGIPHLGINGCAILLAMFQNTFSIITLTKHIHIENIHNTYICTHKISVTTNTSRLYRKN